MMSHGKWVNPVPLPSDLPMSELRVSWEQLMLLALPFE